MLIKHWTFNLRAPFQRVQDACVGKLFMFDMNKVPSNRHSGHIVQYMFANLGGSGILNKELKVLEKLSKNHMTVRQINLAYDFISEHGPRGTAQNQHMHWADLQRHDAASPLYGWSAGSIKEALRNVTVGRSLAQEVYNFPLTLKDIRNWTLLNIVAPVLYNAREFGLLLVGVTGMGKTPLAHCISMGLSHHYLMAEDREEKPSFKTTNHLDFLRAEPANMCVPIVFEDGPLAKEPAHC